MFWRKNTTNEKDILVQPAILLGYFLSQKEEVAEFKDSVSELVWRA
jgi:hypothetical protein